MQPDRVWNVVTNPAWRPLTNADVPGYVVLAVCAAALVGLTLWTYLGNPQTTTRRLFVLIALRLLALVIAVLTALRPALAVTDQPRVKSTIVIVLDASESMAVTDESDKLSRSEVMRRVMEKCAPLLKQLEDEQQVTVHLYHFADAFNADREQYKPQVDGKDVAINDWIKSRKPDGKRTDFGLMLQELYKRYQGETNPLRALIVVSDGGNNVNAPDPTAQAMKWRGLGCPIYCFMVGRTDTKTDQKDIAFTSIAADPSPVPVKADLTVRGTLNASGLEGSNVKVRLTLSKRNPSTKKWEELSDATRTEDFRLFKPVGNEIEITTKAPEKPGQVRVTLEIVEGPAEDRIQGNNKISTFVSVIKEGVRLLVIDRLRPELKFLRYALATDKRFDFVELVRQTDEPPAGGAQKLDVLNEAYDVILLGDVSPARLKAIDKDLEANIAKLVREKGVGLIMTGGIDSFGGTPGEEGGGWKGSPLADLLPTEVPGKTAQADGSTEIKPLPGALREYIMKLDPDAARTQQTWARLGESAATRLGGFTVVGRPKQGATVYATGKRVDAVGAPELPLLVGHTVGNNARVLAFGADQTWKWVNLGGEEGAIDPDEGSKIHARFWKQVVLWLAHQDEVEEGTVWVKPEVSRLAVNGKNHFPMGVKDKHGDDIPSPKMRYQVLKEGQDPDEKKAKPAERGDKGKPVGNFEAKEPGEYRVVVWGEGKDPEGGEVRGDAEAWFDVYPEVSDELLRPAARDDFLLGLETTANGTAPEVARKADKLPTFLQDELIAKPLKQTNVRPKLHPDWRRNGNSWFLPLVLVIFVAVLGLEWGLRRVWGLV
jgi:hypothetical protein